MNFKILLFNFLLFLNYVGFSQSSIYEAIKTYNTGSIDYIFTDELKQQLDKGESLYLLDARAKEEYDISHFKDAIWVGYKNFEESKVENLDRNTPVVVYCSIGVRSEQIGEQLKELGFTDIKNLYGGIFDWSNKGYPIYKNEEKTDTVHGFNKFWSKFLTQAKTVY
jgi:rhodanese-related sulfurtransferase